MKETIVFWVFIIIIGLSIGEWVYSKIIKRKLKGSEATSHYNSNVNGYWDSDRDSGNDSGGE